MRNPGLLKYQKSQKDKSDRKGRKPVFYKLNSNALYVVGVEFWSISATVVISDFTRKPIYSSIIDIPSGIDGEDVLNIVYKLIKKSLEKMNIKEDQLAGIGVGAPGKVDTINGRVIFYSRIKGLNNVSVKDYLEERIDAPVLVHNNCSVIALNEYTEAHSSGAEKIMSILLRGGVGGTFMNSGKIVTSQNVTAMEIGHMSVNSEGRLCSCGFKGCLETYLSEEAILNDVSKALKVTSIKEMDLLIQDFKGNTKLVSILDKKAEILAFAVRNLSHLLSPDLFLVISRSFELSNYLSKKAEAILDFCGSNEAGLSIKIKPVCYNPLHAGMGACDIIFNDFFFTNV